MMFKIEAPDTIGEAVPIGYAVINLTPLKGESQKLACFAAVCQYKSDKGYYLFYCDSEWAVFSDTWHETIEDALDQAKYDYQLNADKWQFK